MWISEVCLRFSLRAAHEQLEAYKRKLNAVDDYEHQVRLLREEVSYLSTEKAMLKERYSCTTHCTLLYRTGKLILIWLIHVFYFETGEKSFSQPSAQTQPLFQPIENWITHQGPAHQLLPACPPCVPLQWPVRCGACGGPELAPTLHCWFWNGPENYLNCCCGMSYRRQRNKRRNK